MPYLGATIDTRVRAGTECAIREEQCGFRQGRGCMDQVFAARQVCEKYIANGKDVFWAFMDLEKAYDTIGKVCGRCQGCTEWEENC